MNGMNKITLLSVLAACWCNYNKVNATPAYKQVWEINEWVVDYKRPTVETWNTKRVSPFHMKEDVRSNKYLINGHYPGPQVQVYEGEEVEITVVNNMGSEATTIHWHGISQKDSPWMDGTRGVSQAPILPGQNFTYTFIAEPAGTHYYHAHMDSVQTAKGIKGAFVVLKKPEVDPVQLNPDTAYDEDLTVVVSDEWREPDVCLRLEGAMAGNDVCADIRDASFNGQVGEGTKEYPYTLITVEKGKCYRMRFIFAGSNTENFIMELAGHDMTLLAIDGSDVKPIKISSFNMHLGERYDVLVCANQDPGNYLITATYDYACDLVKGNFIPPGFSAVPRCDFFSFLNYKGHTGVPSKPRDVKGAPSGTGGGRDPKPAEGVVFDLTGFESWSMTSPLVDEDPLEDEPDIRIVMDMGLKGPVYDKPTDKPLTKGRWYLDVRSDHPRPFNQPSSPLLHTKGECGAEDTNVINIPETARTVELVLNNLGPTAHVLHLHGIKFKVINYANFEWCKIHKTTCFVMPKGLNPCPAEDRRTSDPENPNMMYTMYWGCEYNDRKDKGTRNIVNPLIKDMLQVWQRSWAVIRFTADQPGMWPLHCHMEQHIPLGMSTVLNILPSQQKMVPGNVPTAGTCPKSNHESGLQAKEFSELKEKYSDLVEVAKAKGFFDEDELSTSSTKKEIKDETTEPIIQRVIRKGGFF